MWEDAQRVVVIQDASRGVSSSAIKWAIDGLSLKPGDELTLLGVLHQVNNPSTFSIVAAGKLMGYKSRVDSKSLLGTNRKIIIDEITKKEAEYENNSEMLQISKLYEMKKIIFKKKVVAGSSPKVIAVKIAKDLQATWIILDRQMKRDKGYFLEMMSCGISRMKRNSSVQLLRGPIDAREKAEPTKRVQSSNIKYNEMLEQDMMQDNPDDDDLFSLEFSPIKPESPKKSSNDEKVQCNDEGYPHSIMTSDFYFYQKFYAAASIPGMKNQQISSSSSSWDAKQADKEDYLSSNSTNNSSVEVSNSRWHTSNGDWNPGKDQQQNNFQDKILTDGVTKSQPKEILACFKVREEGSNGEPKIDFTFAELHTATNGFSSDNYISEGGFGSVFKGQLKNGQWIAVKQLKLASMQGEKEFRSEVHLLTKARHRNVVKLLGSCSEGNHRLLVYEYVSNGSLDQHLLKDNPRVLSWKERMNIALGSARGLNYLHQQNIIHRDMRPSNILIAQNYEPLVGDFGLARTQRNGSDDSSENKIVGTFGYVAPEYAERGKYSNKTDVYSFGVVLLELITGRNPTDKRLQDRSLVGWARPLLKERKYPELIDERLLDSHDVHQLFWMVSIAEKCLSKDADKRPSMEKVENALRCIIDGGTANGIEEFSPMRSLFSMSPLSESRSALESDQEDTTLGDILSSNKNNADEAHLTIPAQSNTGLADTTKDPELLHFGKSIGTQKKKGKTRSQIFYDEMLS